LKNLKGLSLYWKCQIIGWLICCLYWVWYGINDNYNYVEGILDFTGDFIICVSLTHLYRIYALRNDLHKLSLKKLLPKAVIAIFLLSTFFMLLVSAKLYVVRIFTVQTFNLSFVQFFKTAWVTLFSTGIRLMSIWVLAYHLYLYAQREINTANENARLSVLAKEVQLNNLSAQLNPHFFFNSLNNIKFLVIENPVAARRAIDLLSSLLRNSLDIKQDKLITVDEEINFVKDYLELEKLRLEERLLVHIKVQENICSMQIPPFSIQCLVENAVKHGIDKIKNGGCINVRVCMNNGFINISVENPGRIVPSFHPTVGIKNLEERLRLQYNEKVSFQMNEVNGKVLAQIQIPVK
jgi:sensor histidine kinase YesM